MLSFFFYKVDIFDKMIFVLFVDFFYLLFILMFVFYVKLLSSRK